MLLVERAVDVSLSYCETVHLLLWFVLLIKVRPKYWSFNCGKVTQKGINYCVFTAVSVKIVVFWAVASYLSTAGGYQCFRGIPPSSGSECSYWPDRAPYPLPLPWISVFAYLATYWPDSVLTILTLKMETTCFSETLASTYSRTATQSQPRRLQYYHNQANIKSLYAYWLSTLLLVAFVRYFNLCAN